MDVQDPIGKPVDKALRQHSHETGQNGALGPMGLNCITHRFREPLTIGVVFPPNNPRSNPGSVSPVKSRRAWIVRDNTDDPWPYIWCVDKGLKVGARARCEYCDVDAHPPLIVTRASVGPDGPMSPATATYD